MRTSYVLRNNKGYLTRDIKTGNLDITSSIGKAMDFKSPLTATNRIGRLPLSLGSGWKAVPKELRERQCHVPENDNNEFNIGYIIALIKKIQQGEVEEFDTLQQVINDKVHRAIIENNIGYYDNVLNDLNHKIEAMDDKEYIDQEWAHLSKKINNFRRKRRKLKIECEMINYLSCLSLQDIINNNVIKELKKFQKNKYTPRVLKELF